MTYIDTHSHLYLEEFQNDREDCIRRAEECGVNQILLPNIDSTTIDPMLELVAHYKNSCFPMLGLHPTSVKENYLEELNLIYSNFSKAEFIAVGEVGIDLYWDKTFLKEQQKALEIQIGWALEKNLPLVIHMRESFDAIWEVIKNFNLLQGVFHCYSGNLKQAEQIIEKGFYLGIGGVVTYKKSELPEIVEKISLNNFLLETDAPFLTPVPYRGKRNESAYISIIAEKVADLKKCSVEEVAITTSSNAKNLFRL